MGSLFEHTVHPTYLELNYQDSLAISDESGRDAWTAVGRLCEESGRAKVLIETPGIEGPPDTMSAFESGRVLSEHMMGLSIAICCLEERPEELTMFFKTVAQNRGVRLEFFFDPGSARQWLDVDTGENAAVNH